MNSKSKNKKSDSETSVFTRKNTGKCGRDGKDARTDFPLGRCSLNNHHFAGGNLNRKISKSLDELDWRSSANAKDRTSNGRADDLTRPCNRNKLLYYKKKIVDGVDDDGNKFAKTRIVNLLLLNAWRKERLRHKLITEKMENLHEKQEGFEMQVYLLRQLLNSERDRVEMANENIHGLLQKIEKSDKNRQEILKKSVDLQNNFNDLANYCSQIEDALRNQANDIITSKQEAENWEKQLEKEREKLKKMEADEVIFKEKIRRHEEASAAKAQEVERLTERNRDLRQKWEIQVRLNDETMAEMNLAREKLKESTAINNELEKVLDSRNEDVKRLNLKLAALENKLQEESEKNGLLAKCIMEKSNALCAIENKLLEVSKSNRDWSTGIMKFASVFAKIPVACICTVGSLLLPLPSYRI